MNDLIFQILRITAFSSCVSLASTYFLKKIGVKYRLFDDPSGDPLKIHKNPIPYTGGLGIFIGFVFGLMVSGSVGGDLFMRFFWITISGLIVILWGFWDDWKWKRNIKTFAKLVTLLIMGFVVARALIFAGISLSGQLGAAVSFFVAGLYVVGSMTSINMEDGLDGLAAGLAGISLIAFAFLSISQQNDFFLVLSLSALGGIIGFLFFNWNPASVFMGDSGSHFLGFILAALALGFSSLSAGISWRLAIPALIIGLPVFDTGLAISRRILNGKSPFAGDRGHLYDKLCQSGLSVKRTVFYCCIIQVIMISIGVISYISLK